MPRRHACTGRDIALFDMNWYKVEIMRLSLFRSGEPTARAERAVTKLTTRLGELTTGIAAAQDAELARRQLEFTTSVRDALTRLLGVDLAGAQAVTTKYYGSVADSFMGPVGIRVPGSKTTPGWQVFGRGDNPYTDTPGGLTLTLHLLADGKIAMLSDETEGPMGLPHFTADFRVMTPEEFAEGYNVDYYPAVYQHTLANLEQLGR